MSDNYYSQYLGFGVPKRKDKPVSIVNLFSAPGREFAEINIRAETVLQKHTADVPIALVCLAGSGEFRFGAELAESRYVAKGDFLTLEAHIDHEIAADSDLRFLLIKFK